MANYRGRKLKPQKPVENHLIEVLKTYTSPAGYTVCKGSRLFTPKYMAEAMVKSGMGKRVSGTESQIFTEAEILHTSN